MAASTVMDASYDRKRYVRESACAICQTLLRKSYSQPRGDIHAKASVEWVVLSGKFDVETGPVFHVPGHERTRETLVAGSFMVIPKGQPHKVHCLEPGVVFVSYEGNPDITPIAEHDA